MDSEVFVARPASYQRETSWCAEPVKRVQEVWAQGDEVEWDVEMRSRTRLDFRTPCRIQSIRERGIPRSYHVYLIIAKIIAPSLTVIKGEFIYCLNTQYSLETQV
jgi:hypothetical protein